MKLTGVLAGAVCAVVANASTINIDFSVDDGGMPLVNGQDISSPAEFGNLFDVSSGGPNAGAAIFDTDPGGPNAAGPDPDLLVGLGNALILQNNNNATQSVPGIFDEADDDANGGFIVFDFLSAVEMQSVAMIDINGNTQDVLITMTDAGGFTRTYDVPSRWTKDVSTSGPNGWQTLDLTTLAPQPGEGGSTATAVEDAGFDPAAVLSVRFAFEGSGALDNLTFVPEPSAMMMLAVAMVGVLRRR